MAADDTSVSKTRLAAPGLGTRELQHFRLESLLGEGGMGMVYRGYDTKLHRPVAIKLLGPALTSDPERRQRFIQEARAAARITHPAVAQIYDVDEQESTTFLVMELVEGKTVRQLIQDRELDLLGSIDIAIQVTEGLGKAHSLGIVHRDIKPANIMVTPDGHAKILDFGLAKLLDPVTGNSTERVDLTRMATTQTGMVLGTPAYMSPEQVRGMPVDFRADIFSVGVLIFEMATGHSPFERPTMVDSLHAVAFDETPPMSQIRAQIPPDLQRIVSRCLRKRPEDRYANANLLADDLRRLRRETESGLAQKTTWRQRVLDAWDYFSHLSPSRYRWFAIGAGALALALYFSFSKIGVGGVFFLVIAGLLLYRHIRNRPQNIRDLLVRRIAKIPEVRAVTVEDQQVTVVIERPLAQLYARINSHVGTCNRKLYYGKPLTVCIVHDLTPEQLQKMLTGPGVQHVREDVLSGPKQPGQTG